MAAKNSNKSIRAHIIVKGHVQGIFFRLNTKRVAMEFGLRGYVKNLDDGNVEIVAEGKGGRINEFIEFCKVGPKMAKVEGIDIKFEKAKENFESFEIKY